LSWTELNLNSAWLNSTWTYLGRQSHSFYKIMQRNCYYIFSWSEWYIMWMNEWYMIYCIFVKWMIYYKIHEFQVAYLKQCRTQSVIWRITFCNPPNKIQKVYNHSSQYLHNDVVKTRLSYFSSISSVGPGSSFHRNLKQRRYLSLKNKLKSRLGFFFKSYEGKYFPIDNIYHSDDWDRRNL